MRSFLGPDQRMKFVLEDEDGDSCLISSCSELLCSLDVEHPVGRIAVEASVAHQKSHGTGTTTMMTMAGLWANEIQSLITQGIPIPAIIKYGDECLEQCLSSLESIAVPCTKLIEFSDLEIFADAKLQANTSSKWSNNCEDNSSTREQLRTYDQFVEVQFSSQSDDQSISRPTMFESRANLPEIDLFRDSAPEMQDDDDDDVSWFFEGTSQTDDYSLEQHQSDCAAVFRALEGEKCTKDGKEATESLTEHAIRRTSGNDSDDEFDSCFPLQVQDAIFKPTKSVYGKSAQDDSDDEFDSCFPLEEKDTIPNNVGNSIRKPTQDYSDDEFDSCFPVEVPTTSQKIKTEESTNGIKSEGDDTDNQQTNELDVNSATNPLEAQHTAEKLERYQMASLDAARRNMDCATRDNSTRTKCQSAILESIQTVLKTKQEKVLSKQLGTVQNNSRHFRSFETVMGQLINEDQSSTSGCHRNEAVSEFLKSEEGSGFTCPTVASQIPSKCDTNVHKRSSLPNPSPQYGKSKTTVTKPQQERVSGMQEVIEDLVKARTNQTVARRLVSLQNSSRHFRTMESAAIQSVSEEVHMTSGQGLNPEVTLATSEVSDKHKRISSSRDDCQESRRGGSHVELFSETYMNTATNWRDLKDTDEQQICDIEQLGFGLSHGSDLEMGLIIEAFKIQIDKQGFNDMIRVPDLNCLNVCTIAGPQASDSHLQAGLLLSVDPWHRTVIAESEGKCLAALLVNGDATPTFKHAGYKNKVKRTTVNTWTGIPSTEEKSWLRQIVILLQELDVKLLILKGHADEHLVHHCISKKILLLQDVPYKSLLALGEACSAPILTYLTDATVDDTACGINVACWESGWAERTRVKGEGLKRKLFARVCVDGKVLQTAVLCHPVSSLLPASQARFWASAHSLQGVVADGCFLPGAGLPEQTAIKQLLRLNELTHTAGYHDNLTFFKSSIVSSFVEGFIHYLIQVLKNMGKLDDKSLAKASIMSGLQKDKLEPVLSSSIQPEPINGIDLPDHTLNPTGRNWPEPDKSSKSQFNALASEPGGNLACSSGCNTQAKCLSETHSSKRTDTANQNKDSLTSSGDKTSIGCDGNGVVYDSYTAKKTAWENAWTLLKTVLRIDANIVTGVQEQDKSGSSSHSGKLVIL
ncbi:uncharacterized protein LOC119719330 isoform X2 [Patiria miniata]|nr:uncharacterized protein LOC119719330 isoform X2 [Patiria miniata]